MATANERLMQWLHDAQAMEKQTEAMLAALAGTSITTQVSGPKLNAFYRKHGNRRRWFETLSSGMAETRRRF